MNDPTVPVSHRTDDRLLVGDRVRLAVGNPFAAVGQVGTVVGIDRPAPRQVRVTWDDVEPPFDVMDCHRTELERV